MAKDPFEQFAIPNEMRAFAEQSVAQAAKPSTALSRRQTRRWARCRAGPRRRIAALPKSRTSRLSYAEQNVAATFDFAQKLMSAKDAAEVMGLQSEYLSRQMQALSTQVQELGQSAAKIMVDAAKPKT